MMGIEPEKTIYDLVMARRELDTDALAGYVTAHQSGVHVLPAPLRPEDAELVTEERLGHLFAVAKESYDVIVVDTPPFFHGPVLSTLDRTDQLLLVGIARRAHDQEHQAHAADARPAALPQGAAPPAAEPHGVEGRPEGRRRSSARST